MRSAVEIIRPGRRAGSHPAASAAPIRRSCAVAPPSANSLSTAAAK
jgi:hypothetical protein